MRPRVDLVRYDVDEAGVSTWGMELMTFKQAGMIFEGDRPLRRNYAELGAIN